MAHRNIFDFASPKSFIVIGMFFIIGFAFIVIRIIYGSCASNKHFFQSEIHGTVQKIHTIPRNTSYLIGDIWYLIKGECIDYINIGDSIVTEENSYFIYIFEKNTDSVKYSKEVKTIVFEQVGDGKIPWKYL